METTPYILNEFKAFTLQSKIANIRALFNETTYSHFPIVKNNQLIGVIAETDIQGLPKNEDTLENYYYLSNLFFTKESTNLLEILKVFASNETNLIPVINTKNEYLGYYDLIDILHVYKDTPFLNNEGVIILLEKELRDYSFSEICQIVESNNGKVLGLFISETNSTTVKVTLKFSAQDVNEIIQTFRRYSYQVLSNHKEDFYLEDLKDRSDYLRKYLNI
ncbi:MAG: CBS domain-containing protein [Lutibacter sp.]|uniref:CBS domain-containing protein n=1 Tax=Lutibacter sp. TaxID=1925666 RepID=UPI0019EA3E82|nr:CBS domain-containing protein [Lutibacter sp.]NOR27834.1 CBS domain-containing protein [Lutibacter sp.]